MSVRATTINSTVELQLSRPGAMNAFDLELIEDLQSALLKAESDKQARAVVIRGDAEAFSVGLDIELLNKAFDDPPMFVDILARFARMLDVIERLELPVVACVEGLTRAGGFELLLACDAAVVSKSATIGDTHLRYGVPPGGGATARLTRAVGPARAKEILFSGRWLDPSELLSLGLATKAVSPDEALAEARSLAESFHVGSRNATATTKRIMREQADLGLDDALTTERQRFDEFVQSDPEAGEAARAFKQGRKPKWSA